MLQNCFDSLPQSCALTQSCLGARRTIPLTSWLGCSSAMHSTVGPYIDRWVPFQIMATQFGLPSCRNIKDDQWKQDAPQQDIESHSKGSEYLYE
jgi:hypothetical protein